MAEDNLLSVIIPAFNEEETVKTTARTIGSLLAGEVIPFELLFVDDGSKDRTWEIIQECVKETGDGAGSRFLVRGISFSRNFGKESAIFAGLERARGNCCVVIDCDLQHPPEKIVEMYHLWEQGFEVVEGIKSSRGKESAAHAFAAKRFYSLISRSSGIDMSHASDFKLLDRKAVEVLLHMPEKNAFFRALSSWIGFKSTQIEYDVQERMAGTSKWSTRALFRYAINNISSFTTLPMQIVTMLGSVLFVASLVLTVIALIQKISGSALGGFTTVIILICFTGSIVMISLGIIGYYVSRIFEEVKGRPRYIISEEAGNAIGN